MMYDWSRFNIGMHIEAPAADVFRAWATARGLESFFIKKATFTGGDGRKRAGDEVARVGDSYHWEFVHGFKLDGRVLVMEEGRRFGFTFGGPMSVTIDITALDDGRTRCVLRQQGIPTEETERPYSHLNCRSCWIYFLMALKARLEHGIELRDLNPATADAVSVHFKI